MKKNHSLKQYNTFGISAEAKYFAEFSTTTELQAILKKHHKEKLLILGGGSNILLIDDFDGLVLKNNIKGIKYLNENIDYSYIKAGAGDLWHDLVMYCVDHGYAGVENLALIPGSVGAAPMQNIGAYGVELKDVFYQLEAYNIKDGSIKTFDHSECKFGYRESVFKNEVKDQYIILNVTLRLRKKAVYKVDYGSIKDELKADGHLSNPSIKAISDAVIRIRESKLPDPKILGNAGSFFKNPIISNEKAQKLKEKHPNIVIYPAAKNKSKLAAGWLIDNLGWKGKRIGNYGVHKNQALVLVNYGGATGEEILRLSNEIIDSVLTEYGITLQREVNVY